MYLLAKHEAIPEAVGGAVKSLETKKAASLRTRQALSGISHLLGDQAEDIRIAFMHLNPFRPLPGGIGSNP